MLKWVIGRMSCLVGRHLRSQRHARLGGDHYESKCVYCGVSMLRLAKRNWAVKQP